MASACLLYSMLHYVRQYSLRTVIINQYHTQLSSNWPKLAWKGYSTYIVIYCHIIQERMIPDYYGGPSYI